MQKHLISTSEGNFTVREASSIAGIGIPAVYARIRSGWSGDEICGIAPRKSKYLDPSRSGIVYGWWCKQSSRYVYIGLTIRGLSTRIRHHLREAKTGATTPLHCAIRDIGFDNFEINVLWEGVASEVQERERFYIKEHRTLISQGGFNHDSGGGLGNLSGRSIVHDGVEYASLVDVWRGSDRSVPLGTFRRKMWEGASIDEALRAVDDSRLKPVMVNGVRYSSQKAAFDALSLGRVSYEAYKQRLTKGWNIEDALSKPAEATANPICVQVDGVHKEFRSKREAWRATGSLVKYETFVFRLKKGLSAEEALGLNKEAIC